MSDDKDTTCDCKDCKCKGDYFHEMGNDIGFDRETACESMAEHMRSCEVKKYLIKCKCLQCKAAERNFECYWVENEALWHINKRYKSGVLCPVCEIYGQKVHMVFEIEELAE